MQSLPQHDKIIIVASSKEALEYRPLDGYVTIAVNNAINITKEHTDYWFTLDFSKENQEIMRTKPYQCKYYAAAPEDFGDMESNIPLHRTMRPRGVTYLNRIAGDGPKGAHFKLKEEKDCIATGNSAYGALNLAYHMEPKEIVILGVRADRELKFDHKRCNSLHHLPNLFKSAADQLINRGITVYNANRYSKITCFTKKPFSKFV